MPKRGRARDGEASGKSMPNFWNLTETLLPSIPIAVFDRCTLHRQTDTRLLLLGTSNETHSVIIDVDGGLGTIISASMRDDFERVALLTVVFETRIVVASSITGEIVYNKENPEATQAVIAGDCICLSAPTSVIVDHLAIEADPVVYNYDNPLITAVNDSLILCHSNYDGTFSIDQINVNEIEVTESKLYTGPTEMGMPLAIGSVKMSSGIFVRILCSSGLMVLSEDKFVKIKGDYCDVS